MELNLREINGIETISIKLSKKESSELEYLSECSNELKSDLSDLILDKMQEMLKEVYELTPDFIPET